MNSEWFDFDRELSPEFFANSNRFELWKKNMGMSSDRKVESEKKLKSWSSVNKVSDMLDVEESGSGVFGGRDRIWDTVRDRLTRKGVAGGRSRFAGTGHTLTGAAAVDGDDDILSDINESARRMRNRFSRETFDFESDIDDQRKKPAEMLSSCGSNNGYGFVDVTGKKGSEEDIGWSRKSSYTGNVSFPASSSASVASDTDKTFARSVSMNSEDSVCTEKSADCSTIAETLPDGTSKTRFENNETWLTKSKSGSTICEKKVKDSAVSEKSEDKTCDKSTKRTSYVEKSAGGSSLQEESTSERTVSCNKNGTKTVEQKTSSESYKKAFRSPKNASVFYDELDLKNRLRKLTNDEYEGCNLKYATRGKTVSEKISKLIDEAVKQDNLFKMSSNLGTDIDRMTSDLMDVKGHFGKEKRRSTRRRPSSLYSEDGKAEQNVHWSKLNELKTENETLLQENSKLQSIIQDVTAVNKRWQKYNNERRLYVQKLLSTIQDLQEQINLISEKSAFQSSPQEDSNFLYQGIEKLEREYKEHVAVLELQIKSHKDDWDAERREKQKAVHEKEELERKLQDLLREIKFLKNVAIEERKRKLMFCPSCRSVLDDGAVFPANEFFPDGNAFAPAIFRTAVHVPYKMRDASAEESFFSEDYVSGGTDNRMALLPRTGDTRESYLDERFSNLSQGQKTSGDTIVVEDENGLRLSITEQFPRKDNLQIKSILKRNDKKLRLLSLSEGKNWKSSADERTCEECESRSSTSCNLSIGFEKGGLANVTSFSPYPIPDSAEVDRYAHPFFAYLLKAGTDSRSKSEPNTRSNSSENLKPLRESSSWNNQSAGGTNDVVGSGCDNTLSPPVYKLFPDTRERSNF